MRSKGRIGRNEPCPCGSGKKLKRCCRGSDPRLEWDFKVLEPGSSSPSLAGLLNDSGPLRPVEVIETEPGRGLYARLMDRVDGWPNRIWVADESASYALSKGDVFTTSAERPEDIKIWPFWEGCSHCQELIAERKARNSVGPSRHSPIADSSV